MNNRKYVDTQRQRLIFPFVVNKNLFAFINLLNAL